MKTDYVEEDQMIVWLCSLKEMSLNDLTYVLQSIIHHGSSDGRIGQHTMLMKLTTRVIQSTRVCVGMVGVVEQMILHVLLENNEYARVLVEMMKTKEKEKEKEKKINQKERKRMSEHILPVLLKIITTTTTTGDDSVDEKEEGEEEKDEHGNGENMVNDSRMQLFHMLTGWLIGDWQALKQTVFQWLDWRWRHYEKEEEGRMQLDGEQTSEWMWKQGERTRVAWIQEHLIAIQQEQQQILRLEEEEEEEEREWKWKWEEYVSCLQWILSISNQCITNHVSDSNSDGEDKNCRYDKDNRQMEHRNSSLTTTTTTTEVTTLDQVLSHTLSTTTTTATEVTTLDQVLSHTLSTTTTTATRQPISKESISFILHYYFRYLQSEQSIMKVAVALIPILHDIQQIVEKQGGKEEFQKWMDTHSFFANLSEHSFVIYQE